MFRLRSSFCVCRLTAFTEPMKEFMLYLLNSVTVLLKDRDVMRTNRGAKQQVNYLSTVKTQWALASVTKVSCFVALLGHKAHCLRQSVTNVCPVVFRDVFRSTEMS